LILAESKQKMWAIIKQQWVLGLGGMQYNVYAFGGHAILSALHQSERSDLFLAPMGHGPWPRPTTPFWPHGGYEWFHSDREYALAGAFWSVLLARAAAVQGYDLLVAENGCRPSLEEIGRARSVEADRVRCETSVRLERRLRRAHLFIHYICIPRFLFPQLFLE
jgi:hypothetical protein